MKNQHSHARPIPSFVYALYAGSLALLLSGCTSPADNVGESATAQAEDRECRTTGSAGTKMKRSVCMSTEKWAIADAKGQEQEDLRNEYFRRVRESATLGSAPEFSATSPGGR